MQKSTQKIVFHVNSREISGKNVAQLRSQNITPAHIYGNGNQSQMIQMPATNFKKIYEQVGETSLLYLNIEESKKKVPVLVDEVQKNSVSGQILHVAFREVSLKEKIEATIPIELEGENKVPGASVLQVRDSVEVSALPSDLPENFVVDISTLEKIGQTITIADLQYDKSVVELKFEGDVDETSPVVILQEVREEVEEAEDEVGAGAEGEAGAGDAGAGGDADKAGSSDEADKKE